MTEDRNFDDLAARFAERVYATAKGQWRLQLLKQDLQTLAEQPALKIWDAGCGLGQISLWLAQHGHQLTCCDVSGNMLALARQQFAEAGATAEFLQLAAQELPEQYGNFDLLICHAVLEWLAAPLPSLSQFASRVKSGGYLSLLFYNRNAMVYRNVLRGGWRLQPILDDAYIGKGSKLSPPNPQFPHAVLAWAEQAGFSCVQHTGIRVFHDYMSAEALASSDTTQLFALEQQYCRMPVYRDMGRYIHLLLKKH